MKTSEGVQQPRQNHFSRFPYHDQTKNNSTTDRRFCRLPFIPVGFVRQVALVLVLHVGLALSKALPDVSEKLTPPQETAPAPLTYGDYQQPQQQQ